MLQMDWWIYAPKCMPNTKTTVQDLKIYIAYYINNKRTTQKLVIWKMIDKKVFWNFSKRELLLDSPYFMHM